MSDSLSDPFPSQYENPSDSPGFLLWRVTNAWQRAMRDALKETGLTHTQFVLLASLIKIHQNEPNVTQVMLAEFACTDKMMTSQILRSLEKKAYLTRIQHPNDSRAKSISPTPKGIALAHEAIQLVEEKDFQFFIELEDGLQDFVTHLQKLAHNK